MKCSTLKLHKCRAAESQGAPPPPPMRRRHTSLSHLKGEGQAACPTCLAWRHSPPGSAKQGSSAPLSQAARLSSWPKQPGSKRTAPCSGTLQNPRPARPPTHPPPVSTALLKCQDERWNMSCFRLLIAAMGFAIALKMTPR